MNNKKEILRAKRHKRFTLKVQGTLLRPRLVIHRSLKNLQAQLVDDVANKALFSLSTADKEVKAKSPTGGNVKSAQVLGEIFSKKAKEKGFTKVIFDRAGYLYHGRVKTFAESLRKGGLEF